MFGVSLQVDLRYILTISIYFLHFTSFYLDLLGILSDIIYGIPVGILSDCLSNSLPDIFFDIGMFSDILSLLSDIFSGRHSDIPSDPAGSQQRFCEAQAGDLETSRDPHNSREKEH